MDANVGDLVVCIHTEGEAEAGENAGPQKGFILRVDGLVGPIAGQMGYLFDGFPSDHPTRAWRGNCFRKIDHDKTEACETEFVTLLKRERIAA